MVLTGAWNFGANKAVPTIRAVRVLRCLCRPVANIKIDVLLQSMVRRIAPSASDARVCLF